MWVQFFNCCVFLQLVLVDLCVEQRVHLNPLKFTQLKCTALGASATAVGYSKPEGVCLDYALAAVQYRD